MTTANPSPGKREVPTLPLRPDVAQLFAAADLSSPETISRLCGLLKDENPAHRRWAAEELIQLGPRAAPAVPFLAELLQHGETSTRCRAAELLGMLGPDAAPAVAALRLALAEKDALLQRWSALALGAIGPAAREALLDVLHLRFTSPDLKTAAIAAVAARRIDPDAATTGVLCRETSGAGEACLFWGHRSCVQCVAFSPDGKLALSASGPTASGGSEDSDCTLRLWDIEDRRQLHCLTGHLHRVASLVFFPDGQRCLSGSYDGTVRVWDLTTGQEQRRLTGHEDRVRSVAVSPDGRLALSGGCDQTLRLWDLESGKELRRLGKHAHWIVSVAFTLDGQRAFSGSLDGSVRCWSVRSGREVGGSWLGWLGLGGAGKTRVLGSRPNATSMAFTSDGRHALIALTDRTLRLRDLVQNKEIAQLRGHAGVPMSIVFSADGKQALSGGMDDTVRLWDLAAGKELRRFEGHTDVVMSVALSPDGRWALSGAADRTVRLWRLAE